MSAETTITTKLRRQEWVFDVTGAPTATIDGVVHQPVAACVGLCHRHTVELTVMYRREEAEQASLCKYYPLSDAPEWLLDIARSIPEVAEAMR